ncbi:1-acyl-sn-glycerol-3-phosphate acyltransferase [Saccharomonospora piscinae]|uniref:lysophospholipid acyltransferase family protein n=1 Tax=Saccharomonospora piscinae TaxID=687388 RepID=UPI001107378E|nr:lysophospholipid acyltransferase family protein [Saccharomonospora piscinae]TLW92160.1 1-acyl-sn-glycerol-3-phosphate acyltransferase [Saccharomonospora piscinae]
MSAEPTSAPHWRPVSPCGPACLTSHETDVALPVRAARTVALVAVLLGVLLVAGSVAVLRGSWRDRVARTVFRALLAACGVRLVVRGDLDGAGRGALVVSNHISWLDIVGLSAVRPMRALAKREIASWPVLGPLVARSGSVFLDRDRPSTLPAAVADVSRVLRSGALLSVTPEGTTWCGSASGRFRPAFFQAAIDAGVPVRPVALRYRLASGRETTRPAFVGTESLVESVRRTVRLRGLVLEVFVCPEIAPGRAADRGELAALAQASVQAALGTTTLVSTAPERDQVSKRSVSVGASSLSLEEGPPCPRCTTTTPCSCSNSETTRTGSLRSG